MSLEPLFGAITRRIEHALTSGRACRIRELPGCADAFAAWAIMRNLGKTVVWITDGARSLETCHMNMAAVAQSNRGRLLYFPAREQLPGLPPRQKKQEGPATPSSDPDIAGQRLNVLLALASAGRRRGATPLLIATCVQAMMQKVIAPESLSHSTLTLSKGDTRNLEDVVKFLRESGYSIADEVAEKGQACVRGGILDAWPTVHTWPVRIEFLGAVIESLRRFDPETQRSTEKCDSILFPPVCERGIAEKGRGDSSIIAHLPADAVFVWADESRIQTHADTFLDLAGPSHSDDIITPAELRKAADGMPDARQIFVQNITDGNATCETLGLSPLKSISTMGVNMYQPDVMTEIRKRFFAGLAGAARIGRQVYIFFDSDASREHFTSQIRQAGESADKTTDTSLPDNMFLLTGSLSEGFESDEDGFMVVTEADIYGRRKTGLTRYHPFDTEDGPARSTGLRLSDMTDIEPGDLVVHVDHGIGIYRGLNEIMFNGNLQEVLTIEYAEGAKLHVPVSHAHLLSRYVGMSRHRPRLHSIGGRRWSAEKMEAERSMFDLASSLLETQAQRNLLNGHSFGPDTPWQFEFEAAFPYKETPDQRQAIRSVKSDMESPRPMDRLVCGDAGYGKTEVAMRAAFKAVINGKQAAVLVPTTVLAQQHFDTFAERMSAYPVRIEMLSRFCGRSRRLAALKGLAEGTIDVVIGTHALLQDGIKFKDLGLVIIDEEQRFGVEHKERLKHLRQLVDVLTLTATPIPRTLYMSMTGVREMSLMQTPPGERMAVETIIAKNSDDLVREAIQRELGRDGQVFYLHNRVMTIETVLRRLEKLVPQARVGVAHGQMPSGELSAVMHRFAAGEHDVLLCTTIIESGLDIPRANTILIDRADRFGIADLYQLRGRVGRSNRKAYAYFLLPSHGIIDSDARERISALRKFSGLSASFSLALRDLEIRGAGNLLGAEQSGHITAIGFGLYCQFLKRTVLRLKGEKPPPLAAADLKLDFVELSTRPADDANAAVIPVDFIEDERQRISVYRKIAEAFTKEELKKVGEEISDRFGPAPGPLKRLMKIAELRIVSAEKQVQSIEIRDGKIMIMRKGNYLKQGPLFPRLAAKDPAAKLDSILSLVEGL